eukprot:917206-Amphidinium_carterae.1
MCLRLCTRRETFALLLLHFDSRLSQGLSLGHCIRLVHKLPHAGGGPPEQHIRERPVRNLWS